MFVAATEQPRGRRAVDRAVGLLLVVAEIVRMLHGGAHGRMKKIEAGVLPAEAKVRGGIGQRSQAGLHLLGVASGCPAGPWIGVAIFEGWAGLTAVDFLVNDGHRVSSAPPGKS